MKIGVVGYGVVGRHMAADIDRAGQELVVYDKFIAGYSGNQDALNTCDAAFVCVSTPQGSDGRADLTAMFDVFQWLAVPTAIIRSTIPPGTLDEINQSTKCGAVVFSPEFIGEGVNAPYNHMQQPPFVIIGGDTSARHKAAQVLGKIYNAECEFLFLDSKAAEIAKYAENYFLALKVTWANELRDICETLGADYDRMMSALTHDYRIGRSHTHVYDDARGWGGRCLPKDTAALLATVGEDKAPLLAAVRRINARHTGVE